jgi:NADPH2:quinone reductase
MRALRLARPGEPEILQMEDIDEPVVGPGQIVIRHEAIELNFIDIYQRAGPYPLSYPSGLGSRAQESSRLWGKV